jgi:hypothetical protein
MPHFHLGRADAPDANQVGDIVEVDGWDSASTHASLATPRVPIAPAALTGASQLREL